MTEARQRITEAEYLAIEQLSEEKHEFFNGEVFAMAGASPEHNTVALNIAGELRTRLKGRPCQPYSSDQRVKIEATGLNTYPDVSVVCGEQRFDDTSPRALLNPTLIVEVLSEKTEAYDRGDKFDHYRQLDSLQEYLLVSPNRARVERYLRTPGGAEWVLTVVSGRDTAIYLPSVDCELPLAEIYDKLQFPTGGQPLRPQ